MYSACSDIAVVQFAGDHGQGTLFSNQVSVFHLQNFILTLKGIFLLFNIVLTPFLSGNHQLQMPCDTSSPEVDVSKKEHKMRTILGSEEGAGNSLFQHSVLQEMCFFSISYDCD